MPWCSTPAPPCRTTSSCPVAGGCCASPRWASRCVRPSSAHTTWFVPFISTVRSTGRTSGIVRSNANGMPHLNPQQLVRDYLLGLQDRIVTAMELEDGASFISDRWERPPGGPLEGEGLSRLLEGGTLLERG